VQFSDHQFGPVGDGRYADYAGDIHISGQHLLRIIHDVLDMARIDAGKVPLQEETLSVERSIAETLRLVQPQAVQARVDLRTEVDRRLPLLRADPVRLKQVLLNLLSNAIKFTGPGGVVTVRARRDGDGGLSIAIADTGVGIPADKLDLVLEPFSQAHQEHGSSAQGSGLGLPISKSLMELHGGTLAIDSVEGAAPRSPSVCRRSGSTLQACRPRRPRRHSAGRHHRYCDRPMLPAKAYCTDTDVW